MNGTYLSCLTAITCLQFFAVPSFAASSISQAEFKERLIHNSILAMPTARAQILSDAVPGSVISREVFAKDERAAHLAARCIALPIHPDPTENSGSDQLTLCVFSVPGTLYATVIRESTDSASILWDTTLVNDIPQPALSLLPAGTTDSSSTILVSGVALGLGGMRCFTLIEWSRVYAGIVADRLCGTAFGTEDLDQDGVPELRITDIIDFQSGETFEKYYKFDTANAQYELLEEAADSLHNH